jgi:hypothetical protein
MTMKDPGQLYRGGREDRELQAKPSDCRGFLGRRKFITKQIGWVGEKAIVRLPPKR